MRVTVQVFARLRELAGQSEWHCDLPVGATIAEVWRRTADAHPSLEVYGRSVSCALNEDFARMTTAVNDGDVIAFLPPVSGG